jgi:hypothetical protein
MKRNPLRWLTLLFTVGLAISAVVLVMPLSADVPSVIPFQYFAVTDSGGANNGPGQKDLTQMGFYEDKGVIADPTDDVLDVVWSWDEISVSGNNTLDGCALFDSDGDTFINVSICATIQKVNGPSGGMFLAGTPTVYTCSDNKDDRCTNPSQQPAPSLANLIGGALVVDGAGNLLAIPGNPFDLITNTDPFAAGAGFPQDTTIRLRIRRTYVNSLVGGATALLTNVCSYPSREPNSDPSDCNNPPGGGFLKIVKDTVPDSTNEFSFVVTGNPTTPGENPCPGATPCNVTAKEGTPAQLSLRVGLADIEELAKANYSLGSVVCVFDGDGSAGGSLSGNTYTGASINSGIITVCTFVNNRDTATITIIKALDPSTDGGRFSLFIKQGATTIDSKSNVGHGGSLVKTVETGTYDLSESADPGTDAANYDTLYSCVFNEGPANPTGSGTTISGLTVAKDDSVVCTFTNKLRNGTLIVQKIVNNTADPTGKVAKDFSFTNGANPAVFFPDEPSDGDADDDRKTATMTFTVPPNSVHTIVEVAVTLYTATYAINGSPASNCDNLTVAPGATLTCTITNTANKASPDRLSQQNWIIHDKITITGTQVNAGTAVVHFRLFSDAACTIPVGQNLDRPIDSAGVAVTGAGVAVATPGTYYWTVEYTGNAFNNEFTTACNNPADVESTQIIAKDGVFTP